MVSFILCQCNDDIPGVEKLPPHMHRDFARVLIDDETHIYNGDVIEIPWHDWVLNDDRPDFRLLDRVVELSFSVPWKEVARGLQG